jgi:endonuclease/exonuclease/phosphatase family metal-dependent hydrolase
MKIATWNVAKPVSAGRRHAMRKHIDDVHADVLVLTETHDGFASGYQHSCSSSAGLDGPEKTPHRWVTIWSSNRLEQLETKDMKRTAAARVYPVNGDPYIIFGTVLPWVGSYWEGRPWNGGVAFSESLQVQEDDWKTIQSRYPEDEFFVLGDFNQDLANPPKFYGSKRNRERLELALIEAGLVALTAGDGDPIRLKSKEWACIDHICMRANSRWRSTSTERWPHSAKPIRALSDHFGVAVTLALK